MKIHDGVDFSTVNEEVQELSTTTIKHYSDNTYSDDLLKGLCLKCSKTCATGQNFSRSWEEVLLHE